MVETERFGNNPFLAEGVEQHFLDADTDVVTALLRLAKGNEAQAFPAPPGEDR
jgi:hypothetical protein